jgi:DNA mismatch endonuclease (patch repair protein)
VKKKEPRAGRTPEQIRSDTMRRIRSRDTGIEVRLRKALWHRGVRYRKNFKGAPGTPDIAITKHRLAIFCDGEFWHGKDWGEKKGRLKGNRGYWVDKIEKNRERDWRNDALLSEQGWTIMHFWGEEIEKDLEGCVRRVLAAIGAIRAARILSESAKRD